MFSLWALVAAGCATRLPAAEGQFAYIMPGTRELSYWENAGRDSLLRMRRCATSLRNRFTNEHFAVAVALTMEHAITSALSLEIENELYLAALRTEGPDNRTLWSDGGLMIHHNKFIAQWGRYNEDVLVSSPVVGVTFYPDRPTVRSVDNPCLVRHDLAILAWNTSQWDRTFVCRCSVAYLTLELPTGYALHVHGFTGSRPTEATRYFSTGGIAKTIPCSVGRTFGHFFCVQSVPPLFPFGLDSGASVLDWNTTLFGIASFSLRMQTEGWISYVTDFSHLPYRKWIDEIVYGKNYTTTENMIALTQPDHSRRMKNTCHQYDVFNDWRVNWLTYGVRNTLKKIPPVD